MLRPLRRGAARPAATLVLAVLALAGPAPALAQDAAAWLARAASSARQLNYSGTIVYQHAGHVETSRLVHVLDASGELEKLTNLDGPAREIIRSQGEVRCYYPDAKVVRIEPRTFRNAFPSLSPQQQRSLLEFYELRKAEPARVAGIEAQAYVFEPRDGLRYAHKFWADPSTGLLLKARVLNEASDVVEQFAFSDIAIGGRIDRAAARPTWPSVPPDWQVREVGPGDLEVRDTGWIVSKLPPGFTKMVEGYRTLRGKRSPVAHLVFSDGLVAISVFVEPVAGAPHPSGLMQQSGVNIFMRQVEDHFVTVLGEVPAVTVRQIANTVTHR
ncbi:MAG: MucB/RseB C-terminal domain-containing protein [Pseudomonadota bacterium]|nr:MucB/RseB C-terminal domain-containing protein [Pseudomonadota bacterium]